MEPLTRIIFPSHDRHFIRALKFVLLFGFNQFVVFVTRGVPLRCEKQHDTASAKRLCRTELRTMTYTTGLFPLSIRHDWGKSPLRAILIS